MRRQVSIVLSIATTVLATAFLPVDASGAAPPRCHGAVATIVGTEHADVLVGTPGTDVIVAGRGWDHVRGRGGDDVVCAGPGADVVEGGSGDDRLYGQGGGFVYDEPVRHVGNRLVGGPGDDLLAGGTAGRDDKAESVADYSGSPKGVFLRQEVVTGQGRDRLRGIEVVVGSRHDDVMNADAQVSDYRGGRGDDTITDGVTHLLRIVGGRGADDLVSQHGEGVVRGSQGDDTISVSGAARIRPGPGRNRVSSFVGIQLVVLAGGVDRVTTGSDADRVVARDGARGTLDAGLGDDVIVLHRTGMSVMAGSGDDQIRPGRGAGSIDAGPGTDTLSVRSVDPEDPPSVVDLPAGNLVSGPTVRTIAGVENVSGIGDGDRVIGDDDPNVLSMDWVFSEGAPSTISGGGGDDVIEVTSGSFDADGGDDNDTFVWRDGFTHGSGTLTGGPGANTLDLQGLFAHHVVVDLSSGAALLDGPRTVSGFQVVIGGDTNGNRFVGTDGQERFLVLRGGGSDREIAGSTLLGLGGPDHLRGGRGDDTLDGGDGIDTADGFGGHDRCLAEIVSRCEE